jgi:DNA-binding GntR family transcriptional regulator
VDIRTKKQQAYDYIRDGILTGKYPGQHRLREEHLAREAKVSRGPLREAISQLVSEGLLEKVPGLGVYVRRNGNEELSELYEVREALESFAAARAARNISVDDLIELDRICGEMHMIAKSFQASPSEALARQQRSRWLRADLAFHNLIVHVAENGRIERILEEFRVMSQTFRNKQRDPTVNDVPAYLSNLAWAWRDHRRIVRALQKRDSQAAHVWMSAHIKRARKRTMRLLRQLKLDEE